MPSEASIALRTSEPPILTDEDLYTFHLPGKHDQSVHGKKGVKRAKPRSTSRAAAATGAPPPPQRVTPAKEIGTPSRYGKADFAVKPAVMDADWQEHVAGLSDEQREAVRAYSASAYSSMNGALREPEGWEPEDEIDERSLARSRALQSAMAPAPRGTKTFRGAGADGFGLGSNPTEEELKSLVGQVLVNDAFTSTTVDRGQMREYQVRMEIEVPKGTPSLWVRNISRFPDEQELLLAAGAKMRVESVELRETPTERYYRMVMRVVP